jgi:hypothetical protein
MTDEERIAAAAKKLADEQVQAAVEAARLETRQEVIADEPQPFIYEEDGNVRAAASLGAENTRHMQKFNEEAHEDLMGCALTRHEALSVLTAITQGRIRHITITY